VATGPEGFEPPTTWLKARRSTELSYEPTLEYNVQRYNNAGKLYKYYPGAIRSAKETSPTMGKALVYLIKTDLIRFDLFVEFVDSLQIFIGHGAPGNVHAA
jgi:hypothetical protein